MNNLSVPQPSLDHVSNARLTASAINRSTKDKDGKVVTVNGDIFNPIPITLLHSTTGISLSIVVPVLQSYICGTSAYLRTSIFGNCFILVTIAVDLSWEG